MANAREYSIVLEARISGYYLFKCGGQRVYVHRDRFNEKYDCFSHVRFLADKGVEEEGIREAFYHFPKEGTRERVIRPEGVINKAIYEAAKRFFRHAFPVSEKIKFSLAWE